MAVSKEVVEHGKQLYTDYCFGCHGMDAHASQGVPDLRWVAPAFHENFKPIVLGGALKGLGMVGFDDILSEQDADAIHAYILDVANDAKEKRDNPDAPWWHDLKVKIYEKVGDLMHDHL